MTKERINEFLNRRDVGTVLLLLILLNIAIVVLETVHPFEEQFAGVFWIVDVVSVAIFTVEYLLRVWSCPVDARFRGLKLARIRFIISPLALFDLLAILPFYLPFFLHVDLRMLRIFRIFRILGVTLKVGRYSNAVKVLGQVLKEKRADLTITLLLVLALLLIASGLMYYVENEAQPEAFSSIPETMWWGVATLTTVGYGDMYPITPLGKLLGSVIAILGIGLFALPAGILGSGFVSAVGKANGPSAMKYCPHCGEILDK